MEFWLTFAYAFAAVFMAELGDKTQLAILALSVRGKRSRVLLGAVSAFAFVNGLSSAFGLLLYRLIPFAFLRLAAAIAFLLAGAIGIARLFLARHEGAAEEPEAREGEREGAGFLAAFALVTLAELGDKTQLTTISLAALTGLAVPVALAAISALALMTALTCLIGRGLAEKLHGRKAELLAYAVFLAVGLAMMIWPR